MCLLSLSGGLPRIASGSKSAGAHGRIHLFHDLAEVRRRKRLHIAAHAMCSVRKS